MLSNFGWLIQGTAAAWLMTSLAGTADMVALVQTAEQLPIVVLSLLAGAAADLWDRRVVLLIAQLWMFAVSTLLSLMTFMGLITPWALLGLTFALGLGAALQGPASQSVMRELVPPEDLPAAVTLSSIAYNFARSAAPGIGGILVATAGAQAAFLVNAVSYIGLIAVLLFWRRPKLKDDLPREHVASAIITGLRYALETRPIQSTVIRSAAFAFAATAPIALLPLVARDLAGGGPVTYGLLLGGFGAGAMGSAFFIHTLRQKLGADLLVRCLAVIFALQLLILALVPYKIVMVFALALGGIGWLGSFTSLNISIQTISAFWVQARIFSFYQMTQFVAMALGSWLWGELAVVTSLQTALLAAGGCMLATGFLGFVFHLPTGPAPDLRPAATRRQDPATAFAFRQDEGPVLVLVEYRVSVQDARAFARSMEEVGHLRKRNGARHWQVFQDVADAEHWIEAFDVRSWLDYRRQARRATAADEAIEARVRHYHKGDEPPLLRHLIARHFDQPTT
ncbi:Predicted arabinose efflux permease, MFS family [Arboricoccus pini]|uniref:Predicted arabinose efflux permease, MFS family n=2 Tax=Arboricoccus pini TaxID=1963835 RepID=A0A212QZ73_9PROT|nr:Predicted arabinose efflux permease, MFS family [Arboricoccus pini]